MALSKIKGTVIADDAINADRIADGTVVASDLLDNTLTGAKLATDIAITTSGNITTTGAFTSTGIDDNATSTAITIDSSEKVGIGTSSPISNLSVIGATRVHSSSNSSSGTIAVSQNETDYSSGFKSVFLQYNDVSSTGTIYGFSKSSLGLLSFQNTSNAVIGTNNSAKLHFATSGAERMRIDSSGNVGIGTSSPDGKLHIDGASDTVTGLVFEAGVNGDNKFIDFQNTLGSKRIGFEYDSTNIKFNIVDRDGNKMFTIDEAQGGDISFYEDTGTTPKFFWDASREELGIGTSSPDADLTISSGGGEMIHLISSHTNKSWVEAEAGNGSMWRLGTVDSNPHVRLEATAVTGEIKFLTGGSNERMRIDDSGNVGIGTSSPSNLLHLTGPQNGTALQIANTVDTNGIRINAGVSGLANNALQFLNNSGDSLLIIDGSNKSTIVGNIGPSGYRASFGDFEVKNLDGNGNPGGTLVLSNTDGSILSGQHLGNLTFASYDSSGATTTGGVASIRAVASETYGSTSGANLRFYTHPSSANNGTVDGNMLERMRITSSGNVGIGTGTFLTPDSLLEIGIDNNNLGNQRLLTLGTTDTGGAGETGIYLGALRTISPSRGALISAYHNYAGSNNCGLKFYTTSGGTDATTLALTLSGANAIVAGSLSKGSGSFKIDHPLPSKNSTHHLVHSFTESPQADLIYRGKVDLVNGTATVNIDTVSGMTEGTFVLLNRDIQCFTSNETGWTAVKGSVSGNTLTITAQDNTCTDTISWMVIGERQDQHMIDTDWTDENGKVIVEPLKETEE